MSGVATRRRDESRNGARPRSTPSPRRSSSSCRRTAAGRTPRSARPWACPRRPSGSASEAARPRRHADRRRHRPAHRRASGGRRWSASTCEGDLDPVADALAEMAEVDVVITAGSFDLLVEVVCEDDDHLLDLINKRIRALPRRALHRELRLPEAAQADLPVGNPMSSSNEPRDSPEPRTTTCGCTSPGCRLRAATCR